MAEGSLGWDGRLARLKEEETKSRGAPLLFFSGQVGAAGSLEKMGL